MKSLSMIVGSLSGLWQVDWKGIESYLNREQQNFAARLRGDFPQLSEEDIRIILLIRLGISNKEIARLHHVLPASFRMRRYRIRKKLGENIDERLADFVRNLYGDK